ELNSVPEGTKVFAVVKANAYGHGLVKVAKSEIEFGASGLCVATLDEALEIRNSGVEAPILVLGIIPVEYAKIDAQANISVTVGDLDWLKVAVQLRTANLRVHLGIDSGMGRIGFQTKDDLIAACDFLNEHQEAFIPEGLFTHFATADSPDENYFEKQVQRFKEMSTDLPTQFTYVHCANSATACCNKI